MIVCRVLIAGGILCGFAQIQAVAQSFGDSPQAIKAGVDFSSVKEMDLWVFDRGWRTGWGWVTVYGADHVLKYRFWKAPTQAQREAYGEPIITPLCTFAVTPEAIEASGGARPLGEKTLNYENYESFKRGEIPADAVAKEQEGSTETQLSKDPETYFNRGIKFAKQRNYSEAILEFDIAIKLNPRDDATFYNRGKAYSALGNYQQAIKDLDESIRINSSNADAFTERGGAYLKLRKLDLAIQDFDSAISIEPTAGRYFNRGNPLIRMGQYDKAIADFTAAIKLDRNFAPAYFNRAFCYERIGKHDLKSKDIAKAKALGFNPER